MTPVQFLSQEDPTADGGTSTAGILSPADFLQVLNVVRNNAQVLEEQVVALEQERQTRAQGDAAVGGESATDSELSQEVEDRIAGDNAEAQARASAIGQAVADLLDNAPTAFDTLGKLAAVLTDTKTKLDNFADSGDVDFDQLSELAAGVRQLMASVGGLTTGSVQGLDSALAARQKTVFVNPDDYGADPTGLIDSQPAFMAALAVSPNIRTTAGAKYLWLTQEPAPNSDINIDFNGSTVFGNYNDYLFNGSSLDHSIKLSNGTLKDLHLIEVNTDMSGIYLNKFNHEGTERIVTRTVYGIRCIGSGYLCKVVEIFGCNYTNTVPMLADGLSGDRLTVRGGGSDGAVRYCFRSESDLGTLTGFKDIEIDDFYFRNMDSAGDTDQATRAIQLYATNSIDIHDCDFDKLTSVGGFLSVAYLRSENWAKLRDCKIRNLTAPAVSSRVISDKGVVNRLEISGNSFENIQVAEACTQSGTATELIYSNNNHDGMKCPPVRVYGLSATEAERKHKIFRASDNQYKNIDAPYIYGIIQVGKNATFDDDYIEGFANTLGSGHPINPNEAKARYLEIYNTSSGAEENRVDSISLNNIIGESTGESSLVHVNMSSNSTSSVDTIDINNCNWDGSEYAVDQRFRAVDKITGFNNRFQNVKAMSDKPAILENSPLVVSVRDGATSAGDTLKKLEDRIALLEA